MPERVVPSWLQLLLAMLPGSLLVGAVWLDPALASPLADGHAVARLPLDAAHLALLALAVTLVLAGGGWELATGAYAATAVSKAMIVQELLLLPALPAAAAGLFAAAVLGGLSGALAESLRRPAWLTSALMLAVALAAIAGLAAAGLPPAASGSAPARLDLPGLAGIPAAPAALLGVLVTLPLLLRGTVMGNRLLALRADPRRARDLGIPVTTTRISLHAAAGSIAGLAGLLATAQPSPDVVTGAVTDSLLAVAAAVLGGGLGAHFGIACVGTVVAAVTLVAAQLLLPPWLLAAGIALLVLAQLWLSRPRRVAAADVR